MILTEKFMKKLGGKEQNLNVPFTKADAINLEYRLEKKITSAIKEKASKNDVDKIRIEIVKIHDLLKTKTDHREFLEVKLELLEVKDKLLEMFNYIRTEFTLYRLHLERNDERLDNHESRIAYVEGKV